MEAAFQSGRGVGWHEHSQCLFSGTERFFRTSYRHHLVEEWLPALDGVVEKELTFTERGVYQYLCLVHPFTMRGTVSVDAPAAAVEAPDAVTARGAADLQHYTDVSKAEMEEVASRQRELPGPAGTSVYR